MAVEDLPFVVKFGQDGGGEPIEGSGVGEDLDDVGPPFDLPVQPLQRIGGPDLLPVGRREVREHGDVDCGVQQHRLDLGELPSEHVGTTFSWVRTASPVVSAKMMRMVAATISPEPFSITRETSRTK